MDKNTIKFVEMCIRDRHGLSSPFMGEGLLFLQKNISKGECSHMKQQLEKIRQEALDALGAVKSADELDALRVRFLGKKGELTGVLKMMGKLSAEERPVMGQVANNVRAAIEEQLEKTRASLKEKALEAKLRAEAVDVTIPGDPVRLGHRHPMNIALDEAKAVSYTHLDVYKRQAEHGRASSIPFSLHAQVLRLTFSQQKTL